MFWSKLLLENTLFPLSSCLWKKFETLYLFFGSGDPPACISQVLKLQVCISAHGTKHLNFQILAREDIMLLITKNQTELRFPSGTARAVLQMRADVLLRLGRKLSGCSACCARVRTCVWTPQNPHTPGNSCVLCNHWTSVSTWKVQTHLTSCDFPRTP